MRLASPLLLALLTASTVWLAAAASAQPAAIRGTVRDAAGAPLPGASVYLSGTTRGASADADGRFRIEAIPPGAYRVVGSLVGYQPDVREMRIQAGDDRPVVLTLSATTLALGTVEVEAERDRRWRRRLAWFERALLGESDNAGATEILNPEVLDFRVRWGTLSVEAAAPLVIENRALGYRLTYDLHDFSASATQVRYDGDERFEELAPISDAEAERWAEARARAYRGSLMHLLQSLLAGTAPDEGYRFEMAPVGTYGAQRSVHTPADWLIDADADGWGTLRIRGRLDVTYGGEPEERAYLRSEWFRETRRRPDAVQRSSLELTGSTARIDPQGTPENPFALSTAGHMAFERLADRVPEEYRLPAADGR